MHIVAKSNCFFLYPIYVQSVLHLVTCSHEEDICVKHSDINKDCSVSAVTGCIQLFGLYVDIGSGRTINITFHKVHRKKVRRARFGQWGGTDVESNWPNHCSGTCLFNNVLISLWMCSDALSC